MIGLAGKKRFQLLPRGFVLQRLERGFGFGDDALVFLRFAEFDQHDVIVELALDTTDPVELIFQRSAFAHYFLRVGGVVPEFGVFGLLVQLSQTHLRRIDVKDASSAVQGTA